MTLEQISIHIKDIAQIPVDFIKESLLYGIRASSGLTSHCECPIRSMLFSN